ncbi:MAG: flagellar hook-associated protein FlgK [Sphingomonas sp. 28-66-16]|nr:MAG: flagellar hook-associated protein FlgK [Sphingomonas sp. 28-66-16]
MSDLLAIGASSVRAYQSALTTVSDNIANAATPGFARRTTTLAEISATSGRLSQRITTDGLGVAVTGVARLADGFRATAVRSAGADLARTETSATWLGSIEGALGNNQLGATVTSFFNAAKAVATDPSASTPRTALIESASGVASAFAATGRALDQANSDLDSAAAATVGSLESIGATLAQVNAGLSRAAPGSVSEAQLLDQRDQALEQLSALSDINVSITDGGQATVRLGGANGPVFVDGNTAGYVTYLRNDSGAVSLVVHRAGAVAGLSPTGGALAGIVDGAQRIAGARQTLNQIATDFVEGVNAVQAQGRDLDGNPGAPIFANGTPPTDISIVITGPRAIAAAAVGGGPRDNSNLAALDALRRSGGYEDRLAGQIADNAATLAGRRTVADAQTSIRDGAVAARDQVSGVNLDQEAVDLLRFQQAYQASSRVIQVARETLQSILDIR